MKNRKGFSLVELIVVIAIMAIVLGVGALSISTLTKQKEKTASKDIYNMYGSSQLVAMSKDDTMFGLTYYDGQVSVGTYYKKNKATAVFDLIEQKKIASGVEICLKLKDGSTVNIGDPASGNEGAVFIKFDRNTGRTSGGSYVYKNGSSYGGAGVTFDDLESCSDVTHIIIKRGGGDYDIVIVPLTGKFFYNN